MTNRPIEHIDYLFIWETHGVHAGTGKIHVKHGIDNLDEVIEAAIKKGFPGITFVIHSPRLTKIRYQSEKNMDIKFIRGDSAYFEFPHRMTELRTRYKDKIKIRYGIELEWMGSKLGMQWNRSKVLQAYGADFIIGSVHFSSEGIPYDGTEEEAQKLLDIRGGIENYWGGYIEEVIEMISSSWDMIHIIGHLDLPKLHVPIPGVLLDIENSSHFLPRRMRTLLEMISEYNFALDVNLAGLRKGCGIYPDSTLLKRAYQLGIPVAIGTDAHTVEELGIDYQAGIDYLTESNYKYYVSYSRGIPEKRPLINNENEDKKFQILNLAIEMLNTRFEGRKRIGIPKFSFGGEFRSLLDDFTDSVSLGEYNAIRVRKTDKSITIGDPPSHIREKNIKCIYSHHSDLPGTLSVLLNTLSSEEINIETAYLQSLHDGTATAYLTLTGEEKDILEAIDFVKGTAGDRFIRVEILDELDIPIQKHDSVYVLEVDGIDLPIPVSPQMVLTVHHNSPGTLLILLSALASRNINVNDLQLGKRGDKGYAILGVEGDSIIISGLLKQLGPQFYEISQLELEMN